VTICPTCYEETQKYFEIYLWDKGDDRYEAINDATQETFKDLCMFESNGGSASRKLLHVVRKRRLWKINSKNARYYAKHLSYQEEPSNDEDGIRRKPKSRGGSSSTPPPNENNIALAQLAEALEKLIDDGHLNKRKGRMFKKYYFDEKNYREIGEEFNLSKQTVHSHVEQVLAILEKTMRDGGTFPTRQPKKSGSS
jgi:RNA polymerase sigma factor (sigma-70 family)